MHLKLVYLDQKTEAVASVFIDINSRNLTDHRRRFIAYQQSQS